MQLSLNAPQLVFKRYIEETGDIVSQLEDLVTALRQMQMAINITVNQNEVTYIKKTTVPVVADGLTNKKVMLWEVQGQTAGQPKAFLVADLGGGVTVTFRSVENA